MLPYFRAQGVALLEMEAQHIRIFQKHLLTNGGKDSKDGLKRVSVKKICVVFRRSLQYAVDEHLINFNPVASIKPLKVGKPYLDNFYSIEQANELIRLFNGLIYQAAIIPALFYGLRRSEIRGLKWDAIDFENDRLTIRRATVRQRTLIEREKSKSRSSRRTLPLFPEVKEVLLQLREKQIEMKRTFGKAYTESDKLVWRPDWRPIHSGRVSDNFSRIVKHSNLPCYTFHNLRHSSARNFKTDRAKSIDESLILLSATTKHLALFHYSKQLCKKQIKSEIAPFGATKSSDESPQVKSKAGTFGEIKSVP